MERKAAIRSAGRSDLWQIGEFATPAVLVACEVVKACAFSTLRWHLDEVFVKINGEQHYLWRAVDHEGEVLEAIVTKRRDRKAALKVFRKLMRRYGRPRGIVTDRLPSYGAAPKELGPKTFSHQAAG